MNIMPKKFISSLVSEKIVKNFPKIFPFRSGKFFKIVLFGKKLSRLEKLLKFANLGVKIEENRVKCIKICTFLGNSFPPHLFFPTPVFLFGRIFTYGEGGSGPFMEFSIIFFYSFFLNPSLTINIIYGVS